MNSVKEKSCCFTGHRKIPPEQVETLAWRVRKVIIELINDGYMFFITGGAVGFDTLAAQTVLDLKELYPQIQLILALPCLSQTAKWSLRDKEMYETIKSRADVVKYTSLEYSHDCMYKRNRYLVDNSSICISYLVKNSGGTYYTVK